ncbi:MAG TPA: translesion DNA synthesis-associated protein ImuA [Nitrosospira sp.]|nr:translesion DNA synthesis-associated protein ImuA [Nitrosospira sp.]
MSILVSQSSASLSLPQIETRFRNRIWRGSATGVPPDQVVPSGFEELDKALPGGGWPIGNLTELLLPTEGLGEIGLLSRMLAQATQAGRHVLLVSPPHVPYMPAWENLGMDSRRIVIVKACTPAERLWALEQGVKSAAFGAILGWLSGISQQATRKLQILARSAATLAFLFRPASARFEPSAAPLRILLHPARRDALSRTLRVHLLKRRGMPAGLSIYLTLPLVPSPGLPSALPEGSPSESFIQPLPASKVAHA